MRHLQRSATESLHVSLAKKPISTGTAFAPVLIVEDDEHMRALLKSLTVSLGCRRIADVGAFDKAVERLETEPFALAIIDLHLGDRDGAELIAAIRSHRRAELRTMPILAALGLLILLAVVFGWLEKDGEWESNTWRLTSPGRKAAMMGLQIQSRTPRKHV